MSSSPRNDVRFTRTSLRELVSPSCFPSLAAGRFPDSAPGPAWISLRSLRFFYLKNLCTVTQLIILGYLSTLDNFLAVARLFSCLVVGLFFCCEGVHLFTHESMSGHYEWWPDNVAGETAFKPKQPTQQMMAASAAIQPVPPELVSTRSAFSFSVCVRFQSRPSLAFFALRGIGAGALVVRQGRPLRRGECQDLRAWLRRLASLLSPCPLCFFLSLVSALFPLLLRALVFFFLSVFPDPRSPAERALPIPTSVLPSGGPCELCIFSF
jgi:hypothetical protein